MSTKHGCLSTQKSKRLQDGELILRDHDDDEAAQRWAKQTWNHLKNKKTRHPLDFFGDETVFSLSSIRGTTWAEIGKPAVLRNIYSRQTQTGLGWITMTPVR
jgi:hypothetical protein